MCFDEKYSPLEVLNALENSVHESDSDSSFCISEHVSVTIDALSGESSKESDSVKEQVASKPLPDRKSVLDPAIF